MVTRIRKYCINVDQATVFGWIMFIYYPLYYAVWLNFGTVTYDDRWFRAIGSLLCIPLILKKYWPARVAKYQTAYWYMAITYCLPFFFTFLTLKNAVSTVWLMNGVSALFFLLLLTDVISGLTIAFAGIFFAALAFYLTTPTLIVHPGVLTPAQVIATLFALFFIGSIFSYKRYLLETDRRLQIKLKTFRELAYTIAHEMRMPLSHIQNLTNHLQITCDELIENYTNLQITSPDTKVPYPKTDFRTIPRELLEMKDKVESGLLTLDMLMMNVREEAQQTATLTVCSAIQCVQEALKRYPFSENQYVWIHWCKEKERDFEFLGNAALLEHVIFNLLKNALHYLDESPKPQRSIWIWLEQTDTGNKIYVKDNAKGIPAKKLPYIFDRFYGETHYGIGLGLPFCQSVMTRFGGDIYCDSQEGEYTTFELRFPKI